MFLTNYHRIQILLWMPFYRQLKSPMGMENKRGLCNWGRWTGECEPHIWSLPEVPVSLLWTWERSLETGRYFDVAFEGAQAANWHQYSGTRSDSLASQGWCWQGPCRLCWCYLEANNKTFICLATLGREGRLLRHNLTSTFFFSVPELHTVLLSG